MIKTTPFHDRLSQLNTQGLYTHWQGHLSALRYTHAPKHEYFAVRNAVGVFDTSPLFKYRIHGPDAERFLAGVLVRDVRTCRPGQAQYTLWCDDRGFVMEDGVVFRHSENDFLLTAARPEPRLVQRPRGPAAVDDRGRLRRLRHPRRPGPALARGAGGAGARGGHAGVLRARPRPRSARRRSPCRRTGYTGDLGFEVTVEADDALDVLDAVLEAGRRPQHPAVRRGGADDAAHRGRPPADRRGVAQQPAGVHRPRAGHPQRARHGLDAARRRRRRPRRSSGGAAIRRELAEGTSRWATSASSSTGRTGTGCTATPGCCRPRTSTRCAYESMLYDRATTEGGTQVGYVTSFMYSPVLQRHIGLARVRPDLAAAGHRGAPGARAQPPQHHGARPAPRRCPCSTPRGRRRSHDDLDELDTDVRRDRGRRRPQRAGQRRLPRQGGPAHAGARAERRWSAARRSPRSSCRASRSRRSPTR